MEKKIFEPRITYRVESFAAIHPDKVVINHRKVRFVEKTENYYEQEDLKRKSNRMPLIKEWHNFKISANSQRNLKSKINWLYALSRKKTITTYSKKIIYNHRCTFITLTLPSVQVHPTSELNSECLVPLLQLLKNHLKMNNYVWKLEFQESGNAHWHLITDTYIDYRYLKKAWNRILEKKGYVSAYAEKMSAMSLNEYCDTYGKKDGSDRLIQSQRYFKGKSEKWRNPNSVDARSVVSDRQLSYYLAKYLSKESSEGGNKEYDTEENSKAIRLCYWSSSLSRCKASSYLIDYFDKSIEKLDEFTEGVQRVVYEYCTVLYISVSKMTDYFKGYFNRYFVGCRDEFLFSPA